MTFVSLKVNLLKISFYLTVTFNDIENLESVERLRVVVKITIRLPTFITALVVSKYITENHFLSNKYNGGRYFEGVKEIWNFVRIQAETEAEKELTLKNISMFKKVYNFSTDIIELLFYE